MLGLLFQPSYSISQLHKSKRFVAMVTVNWSSLDRMIRSIDPETFCIIHQSYHGPSTEDICVISDDLIVSEKLCASSVNHSVEYCVHLVG